ncbi:MAG: ATP-binding cassette domain-containing protein [Acidimicrobiia bacterium]
MSENSIEIKDLHKSYGDKEVLKGINFSVGKGKIVAILGPNGAGKTTTIKILSTLISADSGEAFVNGHSIYTQAPQVRASIGLTGQFAAVDEYLTGEENLQLVGHLYHMKADKAKEIATRLIEDFDLTEAAKKPVKTYSGGMKRKIDLAMSLIANPPILFLDEPTTGLDPRSRLAMWETIKKLASRGTTILLTTQYMDEADYLAENIIVIDHGQVIAQGTPAELKLQVGSERLDIIINKQEDFSKALELLSSNDVESNEDERSISLPAADGVKQLNTAITALEEAKIDIETISLRRPTLDDVFLTLTGHKATNEDENVSKKSKGKK